MKFPLSRVVWECGFHHLVWLRRAAEGAHRRTHHLLPDAGERRDGAALGRSGGARLHAHARRDADAAVLAGLPAADGALAGGRRHLLAAAGLELVPLRLPAAEQGHRCQI